MKLRGICCSITKESKALKGSLIDFLFLETNYFFFPQSGRQSRSFEIGVASAFRPRFIAFGSQHFSVIISFSPKGGNNYFCDPMAKEFQNREAYHHYFIDDKAVAGIVLMGTEIKSIREGKVSFNDSFCLFDKGELWLRGMYIAEYKLGTANNHIAVHDRKLLLTKRELKKWQAKIKERGFTIVPLRLFINEKQFAKLEIGLAKGKKTHDKRETIKNRDVQKEIKRYLAR
jgi:SsrA-binding protein